jgi:hypothetical protein
VGRWRLVWIVDRSIAGIDEHVRILSRLGAIADVTGLDIERATDVVGAFDPAGVISFSELACAECGYRRASGCLPLRNLVMQSPRCLR